MNTKPTKKRYQEPVDGEQKPSLFNLYAGIHDAEVAKSFSLCMSQFEELLNFIPSLLAVLLGGSNTQIAGCILKSLNGVPTELLKTLLEEAEVNKELSCDFDEVIKELKSCAETRNRLAHAKWYTQDIGAGGALKVFLSTKKDKASAINDRQSTEPWRNNKEITADEINAITKRMQNLSLRIRHLTGPILEDRRDRLNPI